MKKLNINLCYFIHGLMGEKTDCQNVQEATENLFEKLFINEEEKDIKNILICYCNEANSGRGCNCALEIMYDNAYEEFKKYFEETLIKNLKKDEEKYNKFEGVECNIYLTFSGHSIGGNVSRGLITKLYSKFSKNDETYDNFFQYIQKEYPFISNVIPCSYISVSSPHMGSLVTSSSEENIKFVKRSEKSVVKLFTNTVVGDVGKELIFQDEKVKKPKSVNSTSTENDNNNPEEEKISKHTLINNCSKKAMDALALFPNRTLTAHLRNDVQVKYCSAMGCLESPYPNIRDNEKDLLVNDNINDVRMVSYSGFGEDQELEYYQKEVFNEKVLPNFFYPNTKYIPNIDIDEQIKQALINKKSHTSNTTSKENNDTTKNNNTTENNDTTENYEEMEDVYVTDNDIQQDFPVALIKKFNQIPFRRVSFDMTLPFIRRLLIHVLDIGYPKNYFIKPSSDMKKISQKCLNFYSRLIIADFLKTSGQTDMYTLSTIDNQ